MEETKRKAGRPKGSKNIGKTKKLKKERRRLPGEPLLLPEFDTIPKGQSGRPESYEPWMCDKIVEIAATGGHIAQMCVAIGIKTETTFNTWKKKYPEFGEAAEYAKLYSKAYYEHLNLLGARGDLPGFSAAALEKIMTAKFGEEYKKDNQGSNNKTEITINNLNLSPEEVNRKIAQISEKLKSMGVIHQPDKETNIIDVEVSDD